MSRNLLKRMGGLFQPKPAGVYVPTHQRAGGRSHTVQVSNLSQRRPTQVASMVMQRAALTQGVQSRPMRPLTRKPHSLAGTQMDIAASNAHGDHHPTRSPAIPEKKWHEKLWSVFGINTHNNVVINSTFQNRSLSAMTSQQAHAAFVNGAAKNVILNDKTGVYSQKLAYCSIASATNMVAQINKNIPAKINNTKGMITSIRNLINEGEGQAAAIGNVFSRLVEGVYYMGQHGLLALGGQEDAGTLLRWCNEIARNPRCEISIDAIETFMRKLEIHLHAVEDTFNKGDFEPQAIAVERILNGINSETSAVDAEIINAKLQQMCTIQAESSVEKINRLMEPKTPIHQGSLFMSHLLLSKNNRLLLNQLLTFACTKSEALNDAMDAWLQMQAENKNKNENKIPEVLNMLVSNDAASVYLTNHYILSDQQKKDIKIGMIAFIQDFKANGIQINAGLHYTALVYQEENNCIAHMDSSGGTVSTYHTNASPDQLLPIVSDDASVDIWTRLNLPIAKNDEDHALKEEDPPRTTLVPGRHMMAAALSSQVFRGIYRYTHRENE